MFPFLANQNSLHSLQLNKNLFPVFSDAKTNRKDILCVPCLYGNLINKATHFCETCDVPEPFCTDCAQHHTRQKLSRDHELCDEIENFSTLLRTLISE